MPGQKLSACSRYGEHPGIDPRMCAHRPNFVVQEKVLTIASHLDLLEAIYIFVCARIVSK
jgi:hypothetical protein